MLQELAALTGATPWVVGSMLFFMVVFALVAYRAARTPGAVHRRHAQLPLEDGTGDGVGSPHDVATTPPQ